MDQCDIYMYLNLNYLVMSAKTTLVVIEAMFAYIGLVNWLLSMNHTFASIYFTHLFL